MENSKSMLSLRKDCKSRNHCVAPGSWSSPLEHVTNNDDTMFAETHPTGYWQDGQTVTIHNWPERQSEPGDGFNLRQFFGEQCELMTIEELKLQLSICPCLWKREWIRDKANSGVHAATICFIFFPSNAFMASARSLHTFNRSKKMNCNYYARLSTCRWLKSTGSGPVRSPASCPSKKPKNHNQKQKKPSKQKTHNHNQTKTNKNTEKWDRYQQWE